MNQPYFGPLRGLPARAARTPAATFAPAAAFTDFHNYPEYVAVADENGDGKTSLLAIG